MKSDFSNPLISQQFAATTLSNFLKTVRNLELGQLVNAKILQAQVQSEILIVTAKGTLKIPNPFQQLDPRHNLLLRVVADSQFPAFKIEQPIFHTRTSKQAGLNDTVLRLPQPLLHALQQQPQLLIKFRQSLAADPTGTRIEGRSNPTPAQVPPTTLGFAGPGTIAPSPLHTASRGFVHTQPRHSLTSATPSPIQHTLKTNLPKQQPLQLFFSQLPKLLQSLSQTVTTQTGAEALKALNTYVDSIPNRNQIAEPEHVKGQLQQSGNSLENKLLRLANQGTTDERPLDRDFKALLLKLKTLIQERPQSSPPAEPQEKGVLRSTTDHPMPPPTTPAPPPVSTTSQVLRSFVQHVLSRINPTQTDLDPASQTRKVLDLNPELFDLLQPIEAALAKVQINQAASVKADPTLPFSWLADIPVKTPNGYDVFEIHIREEGGGTQEQSGKSKTWTVSIRFDLEHLGPVKAIVQLVEERIQVVFIAQLESTVTLLQQHLPELEQNLKKADLKPTSLVIQQGDASPHQVVFTHTLLDVTI